MYASTQLITENIKFQYIYFPVVLSGNMVIFNYRQEAYIRLLLLHEYKEAVVQPLQKRITDFVCNCFQEG